MTMRQRFYIMSTNSCLEAITLPAVTVPVRVENDVN